VELRAEGVGLQTGRVDSQKDMREVGRGGFLQGRAGKEIARGKIPDAGFFQGKKKTGLEPEVEPRKGAGEGNGMDPGAKKRG